MFPSPSRSLLPILNKKRPYLEYSPKGSFIIDDYFASDNMLGHNIFEGEFERSFKDTKLVRYKGDEQVRFDSLRGKCLVFVSILAPLPSSGLCTDEYRAMIESYVELTYRRVIDFEMILAIQKTKLYEDDEDGFNHLFSAFPCLAIPFSDKEARDKLRSFIGLDCAIVVDPDGCVLQHYNTLEYFRQFGSEWAHFYGDKCTPFLDITVAAIEDEDEKLRSMLDPIYAFATANSETPSLSFRNSSLPLHRILECDPSDRLKICGHSASSSVKDLAQKYVGLYICVTGDFMEKLKAVHDNCLNNKQELEIVVVCMSIFDDPKSFKEDLLEALDFYNIKLWHLFESNDKILRRIFRIYGQGFTPPWVEDSFIIIPPHGNCGELEGRAVINELGIDRYPFTRSIILKQRLEYLRSLTPDELLNKGNQANLVCNGKIFEYNKIQGKKLLLYLDSLEKADKKYPTYDLLIKNYTKIQDKGWEIVFVPLNVEVKSADILKKLNEMPWPYIPHPAAVRVVDQLTLPEDKHVWRAKFLIAVGEDGRILSRQVQEVLETDVDTESFYEDVLEKELALQLYCLGEEY